MKTRPLQISARIAPKIASVTPVIPAATTSAVLYTRANTPSSSLWIAAPSSRIIERRTLSSVRFAIPVVAPSVALITSLPITINGWGTAEAASVLLYTQLGVAEADALSLALLTRLNFLLMGGMGGLLYLCRSWRAPARADGPA